MLTTKQAAILTSFVAASAMAQPIGATTLDLNFNTGLSNQAGGDLVFSGPGGFLVTFTDDNSNGTFGGNANGVHVNNINFGNIKVGNPADFVLGAFNNFSGSNNFHSSGIVAMFNQGVESVSFFDTDDDSTTKRLFAFNESGALIYQSAPGTQLTFTVDTSMTSGNSLIHSIEFDTQAGTAGGSFDGTFFTIDNFRVQYSTAVPEPATLALMFTGLVGFLARKRHVVYHK